MVDEAGAISIPSPSYFANRNGYTPKWIIVHGTAGFSNARDVGVYFQTAGVAANYVVGQDGTIVQCVAESDGAWANGALSAGHDSWWTPDINPNWVTISIEHVKPHTDNSDAITPAQEAATFRLIDHICQRHGIRRAPANAEGGITGHFSIDPVNRSRCPGPFPFDRLYPYLNSGGNDMLDPNDSWVQAHFKILAPDRWHCIQTGFDIAYGNLGYYRAIQAAPRLPVGPEQKDASGRTWQPFEGGIIIYDTVSPSKPNMPNGGGNCYLEKLDSPLALQLLGSAVNTQIQTLAAKLAAANQAATQLVNLTK